MRTAELLGHRSLQEDIKFGITRARHTPERWGRKSELLVGNVFPTKPTRLARIVSSACVTTRKLG